MTKRWRPWPGGATYYGDKMVGDRVAGLQELGHVEKIGSGWRWATRPIPGNTGAFVDGIAGSEYLARKEVESRWTSTAAKSE